MVRTPSLSSHVLRAGERIGAGTTRRQALRGALGLLAAGASLPHVLGCRETTRKPTPGPAPVPRASQPSTPDEALAALRAGNRRFSERRSQVRDPGEIERIWTEIAVGQAPFAAILGCADSRLSPELIFDQFFGDVFVVREAGNIAASPTNLGSLEYAVAVLESKLLLVLGHSSCGAVKAAFANEKPGGNIQAVVDAIKTGIGGATTLDEAIARNVSAVIAQVRGGSALLRDAEAQRRIKIVGAVYDIASANVAFLDPGS